MRGIQTEEDSAPHHGPVHQAEDGHVGAGGDGVEEVLGAVDVDKIQSILLIYCVLPLSPKVGSSSVVRLLVMSDLSMMFLPIRMSPPAENDCIFPWREPSSTKRLTSLL